MTSTLWQRFEGDSVDGKYLLLKLIGAGSSGGVFAAEPLTQDAAHHQVAVKLMEQAAGHEAQQLLEISSLAGLSHPSLLRSFTPGICTIDGVRLLYLPAEMADESLQSRILAHPLNLDEVRDVGTALAAALVYLHEQPRPFVHRDVKPGNTLRVGARWKLGDFGLLRSVTSNAGVRTRSFLGTAEYAPPESYDGLISPAWDVWSLGVLLHEAATGRRPFADAETPQQLMRAVCWAEPAFSEGLAGDFTALLSHCLDKDPAVRWPASRVFDALEELDIGAAIHTAPHGHGIRRRHTTAEVHTAPAEDQHPVGRDDGTHQHVTVAQSEDADCSSITEAVRRGAPGATIVVKPGRYAGTVLLERPVEIIGDGPAAEIIIEATGREAMIIAAAGVRVCGVTLDKPLRNE